MKLLTPIRLGDLQLQNRIFMAPMTRVRAEAGHVPGDLMVEYFRQRASAGLILTDATQIAEDARAFGEEPGIYNQEQVAGWRRVTDVVHAEGGRIALQLWHPGRATHADLNGGVQPVSSSVKPIRDGSIQTPSGKQPYPVPRALQRGEIAGVVRLFARAAENALAAGFDAVEAHGAHGFLIDQFLRDGVNDRTDVYGGSIENRARFLFEVMDALIAVFGAQRVGLRLSLLVPLNDMQESDPLAVMRHVAAGLQARGVAFLHLRHAIHDTPAEREIAAVSRGHFNGVLIRNGRFTRETGEADVAEGRADAIAYGSYFVANPDVPARFRAGAPLNTVDRATLYGSGPRGYIDYPSLAP